MRRLALVWMARDCVPADEVCGTPDVGVDPSKPRSKSHVIRSADFGFASVYGHTAQPTTDGRVPNMEVGGHVCPQTKSAEHRTLGSIRRIHDRRPTPSVPQTPASSPSTGTQLNRRLTVESRTWESVDMEVGGHGSRWTWKSVDVVVGGRGSRWTWESVDMCARRRSLRNAGRRGPSVESMIDAPRHPFRRLRLRLRLRAHSSTDD